VILETVGMLPFRLGRTGLVKVLAGAVDSVVKADRCANYAVLKGCSASALERYVEQLVEAGLLARDDADEYRRLSVTEAGRAALDEGGEILANPNRPKAAKREREGARARGRETAREREPGARSQEPRATIRDTGEPLSEDEDDRFERLRAWRRIEANRAGLPPYVICHDSTLWAIARANPSSVEELAGITGMGERRIESHGAALIAALHPSPVAGLEEDGA
jgi:ATP-dependent DNA helicase RecQ